MTPLPQAVASARRPPILAAVLVGALLVVAAALPAAAHAAVPKGLQDQAMTIAPRTSTDASRTTFLRSARSLKVRFVRVLVRWEDGRTTIPYADEVANVRALLAAAPAYGVTRVEIVPSIASNPKANPLGRRTPPKASSIIDDGAYRTWIRGLANALKDTPGVTKYYTPLNEPNWFRFIPRRGGADVYRRLLRAAVTEVRAVDPTAKVLFGELAGYGRARTKRYPHGQSTNPGAFVRQVLGLKSNWRRTGRDSRYEIDVDGIALHTYDFKADPSKVRRGAGYRDVWTQGNLRYANKYLKLARKSGRINTAAMYLTEFAYKTHGNDRIPVSRAKTYLRRAWSQARKYHARSFVWYQLRDPRDDGWRSGLQNSRGTAHGTYRTYRSLR